jgi:hypothetical protein
MINEKTIEHILLLAKVTGKKKDYPEYERFKRMLPSNIPPKIYEKTIKKLSDILKV